MKRNKKKLLNKIFLILFYISIIIFFDIILILTGLFEPRYQYGNKNIGHGYPVNRKAELYCEDFGNDGFFNEITNSIGFKEKNDPTIPFDGIRVLFLGDSHLNGICPNEMTIPDVFEKEANEKFKLNVDAQNGAYGNSSINQYYKILIHKGLDLKPDIVIIGIYTGNDFFDLMRKDDRPWITLKNGEIQWHDPVWVTEKNPEFGNSILRYSRVYWLINRIYNKTIRYTYTRAKYLYDSAPEQANIFSVWKFLTTIRKGSKFGKNWWNQMLTQHLYFKMFNKIDNTEEKMRLLMIELKKICDQHSIRLIIAPIPTVFEIQPQIIQDRYQKIQEEIPAPGSLNDVIHFLNERYTFIESVCKDNNIEFYDLRTPLRLKNSSKRIYFPNDFHITPEANLIIADFLAEKIFK